MGNPEVSVVAFESSDPQVSIYDIADTMAARGYHLNSIQDPPGLHVAVTLPMTRDGSVDELIDTLVSVVSEEREKAVQRIKEAAGVSTGAPAAPTANGAAVHTGAGPATTPAGVGLSEAEVKASKAVAKKNAGRAGQLYGVAGSLPDKTVVERLVVGYLDTLYKV